MNLREKFIWDSLLVLSLIIIGVTVYFMYNMDKIKKEYWNTYQTETVGTDSILTNQIIALEEFFVDRANYDFKVRDIPTDLSRVLILDKSGFSGLYTGSAVRFSAGISGHKHHAIAHYKSQIFHVMEGDSVAGGLVTKITTDKISFLKDGENYSFSLIPEISENSTK